MVVNSGMRPAGPAHHAGVAGFFDSNSAISIDESYCLFRHQLTDRQAASASSTCGGAGARPWLASTCFGRALRHLREHRPAAGQPHARRPRQVEHIVVGQEHAEHLGAADDRETAVRHPERRPGLLERSAGRIPEQRLFVRRDRAASAGTCRVTISRRRKCECGCCSCEWRAMHHRFEAVEPLREEALVGLELELVRHDAGRIRDHAVAADTMA